jgi:hypothetical protein
MTAMSPQDVVFDGTRLRWPPTGHILQTGRLRHINETLLINQNPIFLSQLKT